jgi:hypothetical protein
MRTLSNKLIGSKVDTGVDFRLAEQSGDWFVYDVVMPPGGRLRRGEVTR